MKQCSLFRTKLVVSLLIAIPASSAVKAAAKLNVDLHKHPTGGKAPIEISVGFTSRTLQQ
jgi:hypothetical protein